MSSSSSSRSKGSALRSFAGRSFVMIGLFLRLFRMSPLDSMMAESIDVRCVTRGYEDLVKDVFGGMNAREEIKESNECRGPGNAGVNERRET